METAIEKLATKALRVKRWDSLSKEDRELARKQMKNFEIRKQEARPITRSPKVFSRGWTFS